MGKIYSLQKKMFFAEDNILCGNMKIFDAEEKICLRKYNFFAEIFILCKKTYFDNVLSDIIGEKNMQRINITEKEKELGNTN